MKHYSRKILPKAEAELKNYPHRFLPPNKIGKCWAAGKKECRSAELEFRIAKFSNILNFGYYLFFDWQRKQETKINVKLSPVEKVKLERILEKSKHELAQMEAR